MRQPGMLATRLAAFALIVSSGCGGSGPGPAADAQVEIPGSDAAADTPEPPDAPPGDETPADPTCQPDCTGKDCGDDGCGGDCGACTGDTVCKSGRCRPTTCVEPDECPPGYQLHDGCRCRVPPTGVWQCRNDKGLVDCSTIAPGDDYYGQDGHFPAGVLAATDLGDGTARDDLTGLVWAKEASGPFPWQDGLAFPAREQCEQNKAGLPGAGWKLPGVLPLMFIVDYSNTKSPMWHPVFGHEYPSPLFWTATHLPRADGLVFLVGFGGGAVEGGGADSQSARCMLDAGQPRRQASAQDRYRNLGDTVLDRVTGLEWEKKYACDSCGWRQGLSACLALGAGWRLPNLKELRSLVDESIVECPLWGSSGIRGGEEGIAG